MNKETVTILGVPIARLTMEQVLAWVEKQIEKDEPAHLVTANAEIIYRAYRESELAEVLKNADLITADGSGVVWASKKLNRPVPQRVTGVDLVQHLFALAEEKGWGVFFLGAKPEVVEKAVLNTLCKHSKLKVCGYSHGYFSQEETTEVVSNILKAKPQILLVALGAPKQEYFISAQLEKLAVPVVIGVGGSFDILAGTAQRAPRWMQELGLEWFYRLVKEPRRLGRMLALPKFVGAVLRQKISFKRVDKN
jgi:N-acetylglucosaminyldiphosphoundecaprenol N-acetyl-beta-D-mannosaminyltransferase